LAETEMGSVGDDKRDGLYRWK